MMMTTNNSAHNHNALEVLTSGKIIKDIDTNKERKLMKSVLSILTFSQHDNQFRWWDCIHTQLLAQLTEEESL